MSKSGQVTPSSTPPPSGLGIDAAFAALALSLSANPAMATERPESGKKAGKASILSLGRLLEGLQIGDDRRAVGVVGLRMASRYFC